MLNFTKSFLQALLFYIHLKFPLWNISNQCTGKKESFSILYLKIQKASSNIEKEKRKEKKLVILETQRDYLSEQIAGLGVLFVILYLNYVPLLHFPGDDLLLFIVQS